MITLFSVVILAAASFQISFGLPIDGNVSRLRRDAAQCQPPSNIAELFVNLNRDIDARTFLRHAHSTGSQDVLTSGNELNFNDVTATGLLFGGKTCPSSLTNDPTAPIWARSLCPWYLEVVEMPNVFPSFIPQAKCKCTRCVESSLNQCEPVSTNIRVLEKTGCKHGFYTYTERTIPVKVGCACVKARTVETQTPAPTAASDDEAALIMS